MILAALALVVLALLGVLVLARAASNGDRLPRTPSAASRRVTR